MTEQQVYYDEKTGVVFSVGAPATSPEEARSALERARDLMADKPKKLLLVDLRGAPLNLSGDVRRAIMEAHRSLIVDRQAFIVGNPVIRMLAKTIARVSTSPGSIQFFGSEEEAVAWLQAFR